ncbi:hypothetical protein CCM_05383 [Cordyceps militaris CM01]|uniref:Uncharacterized protein n=1 Tax=Cordyceps militaris (strain CM01) TaxID=983644 RepID=G3JJD1_CORMM|nr:uncharacterized protein CCM_05383 [Cordyceps militaris CM01]EGX91225.1 hypothetical protein CCM_05383 [Cordyceps militaris CM01]
MLVIYQLTVLLCLEPAMAEKPNTNATARVAEDYKAQSFRTLADKGYIVVSADGMGTNWRSKPFHDVCYNIKDADRIAWMRAAARIAPVVF